MTSDFETTCQAIADLLTLNVNGLADATVYLLAPWNPAELIPDGQRHLAVWTTGEDAETTEPLTLDSLNSVQEYRVLVWEDGGTESSRGVLDDQAASDFYQLHNDIRRMFHPFRTFSGVWKVRYRGVRFPERSSQVRWMELGVTVDAAIEFAPL